MAQVRIRCCPLSRQASAVILERANVRIGRRKCTTEAGKAQIDDGLQCSLPIGWSNTVEPAAMGTRWWCLDSNPLRATRGDAACMADFDVACPSECCLLPFWYAPGQWVDMALLPERKRKRNVARIPGRCTACAMRVGARARVPPRADASHALWREKPV